MRRETRFWLNPHWWLTVLILDLLGDALIDSVWPHHASWVPLVYAGAVGALTPSDVRLWG